MANEVGSVPTAAAALGVTAEEFGVGQNRKILFTFNNVVMTMTDDGATGRGSLQIYDFAKGLLDIVGGGFKISGTFSATTGAALVCSLGTVAAAADATLTSTEANVIPSGQLIANGATTGTASTVTATRCGLIDGSSTAADLYFNFAMNADPTAGKTLTISGTAVVSYELVVDVTIA